MPNWWNKEVIRCLIQPEAAMYLRSPFFDPETQDVKSILVTGIYSYNSNENEMPPAELIIHTRNLRYRNILFKFFIYHFQ